MKALPVKRKIVAIVVRRKPFDKVDEQTKIRIVEEIKTGMISCLGASRKYRIPRNTIKAWAGKLFDYFAECQQYLSASRDDPKSGIKVTRKEDT